MKKATSEDEVLHHTVLHLERHGGKIGACSPEWTARKRAAVAMLPSGVHSVLDVGLGDLSHVDHWKPFEMNEIDYVGVDGCEEIVSRAKKRFPEHRFRRMHLSTLVGHGQDRPPVRYAYDRFDAVICLDVLYHVPDDDLYATAVRWLADVAGQYLLISYATDLGMPAEVFPKGPGDPGFAWFPRRFDVPIRFAVEHACSNDGCGQPQKQELALLRRAW